jgi:hypothetical protein
LILFEIANVYFIMPMPGSQQMDTVDLAYFLYRWRWAFRILFTGLIIWGWSQSNWKRKWLVTLLLLAIAAVVYMANFNMAADHMFYQPNKLIMVDNQANLVDSNRLVIGVVHNDEARAYPIQFLGYHHQVLDTVGGKPMIITYCTVCRTGRIFEPMIKGKPDVFRLVGMDHFNAMFEDATTRSWWRQVNGEAITGPLKGQSLPEIFSIQSSLEEWTKLYPNTLIMQADSSFINSYSKNTDYETGKSRRPLTGTDSLSGKPKSWVVGVRTGSASKAYDWNRLKTDRIIHDEIQGVPVLVVMAMDTAGFFAFERPDAQARFTLDSAGMRYKQYHFTLQGRGIDTAFSLKPLQAYQEFWHSWQTFNPETSK